MEMNKKIAHEIVKIMNHSADNTPIEESNMLYVLGIMVIYWAFEIIPPGATAVFPIVLFPPLGVLASDITCQQYMRNSIFVFLGGLIIALSCEHSNLHKRIALGIMVTFGCKPQRLQFGIMLVSFLLSMVLTNVAITIMMCPIVTAVMEELEVQGVCSHFQEPGPKDVESKYVKTEDADEPKYPSAVSISMYLGVAYAATVGGTLTLFGSITNLVYAEFSKNLTKSMIPMNPLGESFYKEKSTVFFSVFTFNAPIMILEFLVIFLCLQALHMGLFRSGDNKPFTAAKEGTNAVMKEKLTALGPLSSHEIQVIIIFIVLVILLFSREITLETGWGLHANEGKILDSCVIMMLVILMFMIPANYTFLKHCFGQPPFPTKPEPSLVTWKVVNTFMPWGTMLLIGAGYAIGKAIEATFMSWNIMVKYNEILLEMSASELIVYYILSVTAITQICSNATVANIMIYFMRDISALKQLHNVDFIFPTGVACSIAFMLPVSTPANAVVHYYAHIKTSKMVCDCDMRIRFIDATHPGASHDSLIWNTSKLRDKMEQDFMRGDNNSWLLGDAGYALEPWLLTPYRTPQEGTAQEKFNDVHSQCQNVIERVNGVLKNRWRCLLAGRQLHYAPSKAVKHVALHNMCIHYKMGIDNFDLPAVEENGSNVVDGERASDADSNYLSEAQRIRTNIASSI